MYAKRLRTYKKTGFSIWTEKLQSKQMINAIFDSGNYTEKFEQDIVESEKMLVISSPGIRQDKIDRFLLLIKKKQEIGVKVTIITKKEFLNSFVERVDIYEQEQPDGRFLKHIKFRFPVYFGDRETKELCWDNESTV